MSKTKTHDMQSTPGEKMVFDPSADFAQKSLISSVDEYKKMWRKSIERPEEFWGEMAENIDWFKKWDKVEEFDFADNLFIRYFDGGKLNASYNCLDRHLQGWRRNKAALIWQGEPLEDSKTRKTDQSHPRLERYLSCLQAHRSQIALESQ